MDSELILRGRLVLPDQTLEDGLLVCRDGRVVFSGPSAEADTATQAKARVVANTGCYVATSLLPLLPLLKGGHVSPDGIVIDAKSGVTGAGRAPKEGTLFTEVSEGFHAYGVAGHRHMGELDKEL